MDHVPVAVRNVGRTRIGEEATFPTIVCTSLMPQYVGDPRTFIASAQLKLQAARHRKKEKLCAVETCFAVGQVSFIGDGGRSSEDGLQGQSSNHHKLRG